MRNQDEIYIYRGKKLEVDWTLLFHRAHRYHLEVRSSRYFPRRGGCLRGQALVSQSVTLAIGIWSREDSVGSRGNLARERGDRGLPGGFGSGDTEVREALGSVCRLGGPGAPEGAYFAPHRSVAGFPRMLDLFGWFVWVRETCIRTLLFLYRLEIKIIMINER